jgi:hypothetical protein
MTPQEKAKELVHWYGSKKNALIAVNEILKVIVGNYLQSPIQELRTEVLYWQQVKAEIKAL